MSTPGGILPGYVQPNGVVILALFIYEGIQNVFILSLGPAQVSYNISNA